MSEKTYTYGQCYELLDVDAKTFRRWLEKATFDASKQVSLADGRIKFLTESQVMALATDHGRSWPPRPVAPVDPESTTIKRSEFKLLDDKAREHSTALDDLDELTGEQGRMLHEAFERIEKLERTLAALTEQQTAAALALAEAAGTIKDLQERLTHQPRGHRAGGVQAHSDGIPDLPADLVHVATFAEAHGIGGSTVLKAIQSTRIPAARGKWHHGRTVIRIALNGDGRAAFHEQYRSAPGFIKACPDCQHDSDQAQAEQEG